MLSNINVNTSAITLSLRDPQLQDGDVVNIDLNGVRVLDRFPTSGRHVSFPHYPAKRSPTRWSSPPRTRV